MQSHNQARRVNGTGKLERCALPVIRPFAAVPESWHMPVNPII